MHERPHTFAVAVAAITGATAIVVGLAMGLPIRDPDGVAGPSYIVLPMILSLFYLADILPRTVIRASSLRTAYPALREVLHERWPWRRVRWSLIGLLAFYGTYVGYRNLKSYLPFSGETLWDQQLAISDSVLFLGANPASVLHTVLGTGVSAHVLSFVYISYLVFVPVTLAAALVWNRDLARGYWYVTALCLNFALGAASYYLVPAVGPVFYDSNPYEALPDTGVSALQFGLWNSRLTVMFDPWATGSVHGVAAFASLHVSVVFTAALIAHRMGMHRVLRMALWGYLGLTTLSTIYFGWHYVVDDVAGVAIGWAAVSIGAFATGNDRRRRQSPGQVSDDVPGDDRIGAPSGDSLPTPRGEPGSGLVGRSQRSSGRR